MTEVHNEAKAIEELLEWNICEKSKDGELKPSSDFLIWYYGYLIHEITELELNNFECLDDDEKIFDIDDEDTMTKRDLIEDTIENQIVGWTAQTFDGKTYAHIHVREHTKIIYRLIEEIEERLMNSNMIRHRNKNRRDGKIPK